MNVLVTGGAGYIGSHTCVALLEAGHSVVIADNFSNSRRDTVERIERLGGRSVKLVEGDVADERTVHELFEQNAIDGVIHFAGLKSVPESVAQPLRYYRNNVFSTVLLAAACIEHGVGKFVFSSSATVYGSNDVPYREEMELRTPTSPYGSTKLASERILTETAASAPGFAVTLLRYFNPIGAHPSGLIGDDPNGVPNNLMPYITRVARGKLEKLKVYGNDYPTPDGTGVRDYIHVCDLAEGHIAALEHARPGTQVYNLGSGSGVSVLELVEAFERVNGVKIPYEFAPRRPGDLPAYYADASRAERELGWSAKRGVDEMVRDAWNFERNL